MEYIHLRARYNWNISKVFLVSAYEIEESKMESVQIERRIGTNFWCDKFGIFSKIMCYKHFLHTLK